MGKRFLEVRNALTGGVRKVRLPDRAVADVEVKIEGDLEGFKESLTRAALVAHAEGLGIVVPKRLTKAEIVALIAGAGEGDGADLD